MKKVTLLFGLAGLSLCTAGPMGIAVVLAQDGIPLVCRTPEPGESPNAYIKTSSAGAQGRTGSAPLGATSQPARQAASLPASPQSTQSPAQAGVSHAATSNPRADQPMNQFSREVQTGSGYRVCPPPTMPSENSSTQLYAVPFAVAAAWECYGPREMAYSPRPWRGPDPAVHSPLSITPTRAAPSAQKAKPASTAKAEAAKAETGVNAGVAAPSAPAVAPLPVPVMSGAGGVPPQNGVASPSKPNGGNGMNGGPQYRPTVMSGQGSVAAPLIAPSAPTAAPSTTVSNGQSMSQSGGQPYSGTAATVSPSRDIVDPGDNAPRVAQAPTSLLDAPPLPPNSTPAPSGFSPR